LVSLGSGEVGDVVGVWCIFLSITFGYEEGLCVFIIALLRGRGRFVEQRDVRETNTTTMNNTFTNVQDTKGT
jgi:hypothetical protein